MSPSQRSQPSVEIELLNEGISRFGAVRERWPINFCWSIKSQFLTNNLTITINFHPVTKPSNHPLSSLPKNSRSANFCSESSFVFAFFVTKTQPLMETVISFDCVRTNEHNEGFDKHSREFCGKCFSKARQKWKWREEPSDAHGSHRSPFRGDDKADGMGMFRLPFLAFTHQAYPGSISCFIDS